MYMLIGFLLVIWGIVNVIAPETGWYLQDGWKYRDAEPSDEALAWGRISGIGMVVVGIILFFIY